MDILHGLNGLIGGGVAVAAGVVLWKAAGWAYHKFAPLTLVVKLLRKPLNRLAYRIYQEKGLVKDGALQKEILGDLDKLGDSLDDAWDAGLRGERV